MAGLSAAKASVWTRVTGTDEETGEAFAYEWRTVPSLTGGLTFEQRAVAA